MTKPAEDNKATAGPNAQAGPTGPAGQTGTRSQTGNAAPGGVQSPGMGHMHLSEHITGAPSDVGMAAAQGAYQSVQGGPQARPDMAQGPAQGYYGQGAQHTGSAYMGWQDPTGSPAGPASQPHGGSPHGCEDGGCQPGQQTSPGPASGPAHGPEGCQHHFQHPGMAGGYYGPQPGPFPGTPQTGPFPGAFAGPFSTQNYGLAGHPQGQSHDAMPGAYGHNGPGQEPTNYGAMFGHVSGMVSDIMNGRSPNPQQVMGMLESCSTQFWKGAAVGAGLGLLLSNSAVRDALSGMLGSVLGGKSGEANTDNT